MTTKSTNFNYYEANDVYGALFLQFPKILMYGEQYKHLSSDAELAYMVLKDWLEHSSHSDWADEKGHVYFIFTVKELQDLFNCVTEKAAKIERELQTTNLLEQIQMGFDPKAKKNEPNHLYLSKLDVKATDAYLRGGYGQKGPGTLAASGVSKIEDPHDFVETLATGEISKIENPYDFVDDNPQTLTMGGISKIGSSLHRDYKNNIDTNRYDIDTQKLDFFTINFSSVGIGTQNRGLIEHADEFLTGEDDGLLVSLEPEAVQLLSFWCRTPQQMRRFIGIILSVKYAAEKECGDLGVQILLGDPDLKKMMTKTLRRYFNVLRSDERHIKNVKNYLYGATQNLFGVWWNQQVVRDHTAKYSEEEKSADNDNSRLYY